VTPYDDDRGRRELEPLGVVDIGSNSVRLVVYEGAVRAPTPLFNEKVLCGLGRSVASSGKLGADSVERALAAMSRFSAIARILRVKHLRAVATAAVRDARNGAEFIARAQKAIGTEIQILSGEREAQLAAFGIQMGFGAINAVAGDLGGGSLELVDIASAGLKQAVTLPLGGLRLIDLSDGRMDRAADLADEHLAKVGWLTLGKGRRFFAVGGTWRALARLHMQQVGYPLRVTHGYGLPTRDAIQLCELVRRRRITDIEGIDDIPKARREVLPLGALVLERLLKRLEPSEVVFSVFGIREGLIYSLLQESERRKDPLLCSCEDFARLRSRSLVHARELATWTDPIFAEPGPRESEEERRLRHAACLISDIGWRAHPDYRAEQSLSVITNAAMSGADHAARVFLGLAVYFRHVGPTDAADREFASPLRKLVDRRTVKRARIIGAAIRTAHMLSVGMQGIIDETPVGYEKGRLVLTLPPSYAGLNGERLRRRFEALGELLECETLIRLT
jgi:exopolyphosphatase/guanosine-5'-triphosphate,3'-diphosphate pyrophosphatase